MGIMEHYFVVLLAFTSLQASALNQHEISSKLNRFSTELYQVVRSSVGTDENFVMSPLSVYTIATMALVGARQNTAAQIRDALHLTNTANYTVYNAVGNLVKSLQVGKEGGIKIANLLYANMGYQIKEEFKDVLSTYFGAQAQNVNFQLDSVRSEINRKIEELTNFKIKDFLPPGSLDSLTRLLILNAVYFKKPWFLQFNKKYTKKRPFFLGSMAKTVMVPMMTTYASFRVADLDELDASVLELPYKGTERMLIFLPYQLDGLPRLEKRVSMNRNLWNWLDYRLKKEKLKVGIPKFKIEKELDAKKMLTKLGILDLFDHRKADLSGISSANDLYVSKALHKAFIEVSEQGTEAAASTGVVITARMWRPRSEPFIADHPFLFVIQDKQSKAILFIGRYVKP